MKYIYKPKNELERFGFLIYNLLVENFSQTFYVGGMVRDTLLGLAVTDIDITTEALPSQVEKLLTEHSIKTENTHAKFGVIVAKSGKLKIEIATLRKDLSGVGRYPKVSFISSPEIDSQRRDFSINALYLKPKTDLILDFHNGLTDLKHKKLKFIGEPNKRIKEDPLRILRALRFSKILNFKFSKATEKAIANNFLLLNNLTSSRIKTELAKIKNPILKKTLQSAIGKEISLDIK